MRKLPPIILILAFLGLGTGTFEFLHNLDHHHDEASSDTSTCDFHALLRAPLVAGTSAPQLLIAGEVAAINNIPLPSLVSQHTPARIDCRGPPTC